MMRVYMDLNDGCAPEPVGVVHEECRDALPDSDDGHELIVDSVAEDLGPCYMCGIPRELTSADRLDVDGAPFREY